MSLYLQATIGAGRYLLEAQPVIEIRPAADPREATRWKDEELPLVDLRALFGADATTSGCCVLVRQTSGVTAAVFVNAVEGLIEIARSEWRALPPIGPLGQLLDAVSTKLAQERPMLRLRGERALAAAFGRDTAAGADRA